MAMMRSQNAQKQKDQQEAEQSRTTYAGKFLGYSADEGAALVQTDEGTIVVCEAITGGRLVEGQAVVITIPDGATRGFVGGMQ